MTNQNDQNRIYDELHMVIQHEVPELSYEEVEHLIEYMHQSDPNQELKQENVE